MKKVVSKILVVLIVLVIIVAISCLIGYISLKNWYESNLKAVTSNSTKIQVEIKSGMGTDSICSLLEENKVIKSAEAFKIYLKLNKINNLQAGKYELDSSKNSEEIAKIISNGEVIDESIKITFIEGKTIEDYAKVIAEKTNNTEEDVLNLVENEEYINSLIDKYWFLTDEIKNEDIYYALEGYLRPDTYVFKDVSVSAENIFKYVLDYTDELLSKYREEIEESGLTVHEVLSLASIVELEGSSDEERAGIAGVFFNRLKSNWSLGSDVTTYYAFHISMAESDLTKKQLETYNPYNTRGPNMNGKITVGPICNPSESSINAVLNPSNTDCYFFVSDKNGKAYFSKTSAEHQKIINELKSEGLWYTYEEE
jgi:UPF0755 protein